MICRKPHKRHGAVFKGKFSYFRSVKVPTTAIKRYRRRTGVKSQQKTPYSKLEEYITSTYAAVPSDVPPALRSNYESQSLNSQRAITTTTRNRLPLPLPKLKELVLSVLLYWLCCVLLKVERRWMGVSSLLERIWRNLIGSQFGFVSSPNPSS